MRSYFSENEIADITSLLKEREKTDIECIPQISGIWLHDPSWQTELRLLVLPRIKLTVSRVCFQKRRQGTMGEVVKWMIRYCHNHEIYQICIQSVETEEMVNFCLKNDFRPNPLTTFEIDGRILGDYIVNL